VKGFRMIGENVREMGKNCHGKVIDLIGSGYNKDVLPYAWLALISGLADFKVKIEETVPIPERLRKDPSFAETKEVIEETRKHLKDYWRCLR